MVCAPPEIRALLSTSSPRRGSERLLDRHSRSGVFDNGTHNYADFARVSTLGSTALDRICMSSKCSNQLG